jgi:hypothetical protein
MTTPDTKAAIDWVELNKSDYEGYGDPDCEDYEEADLKRFGLAAYEAGAQAERERIWAKIKAEQAYYSAGFYDSVGVEHLKTIIFEEGSDDKTI